MACVRPSSRMVDPSVAWMKPGALADGAAEATQRLWSGTVSV
jgi:hypothetical protein